VAAADGKPNGASLGWLSFAALTVFGNVSIDLRERMDYNELLFAAKVNEMAQALHAGTMPHELQAAPVSELVSWIRDNPAERFIPDVLAQLKNTAQLIRELEAKSER
jgi:hypothetical protein